MFTGIVTHVGKVVAAKRAGAGRRIAVRVRRPPKVAVGGSVAIDGVCLSVVAKRGGDLSFDVVAETLKKTTLGARKPGDAVNIEFPVRAGEPLGGHIVQGHVDGVGTIESKDGVERGIMMRIRAPNGVAGELVEKGSVAVDGISLTVVDVADEFFTVALIPATLEKTTLGRKGAGDAVNVETDILAKYVRRRGEGQPC